MRIYFFPIMVVCLALFAVLAGHFPWLWWGLFVVIPICAVGVHDFLQTKHTVLRNFPVLGHFRFLAETVRPPVFQYFIESDTDGVPFDREQRSLVYERAKRVRDTIPFGTKKDVYEIGYEWVNHSMVPGEVSDKELRVQIGGPDCLQPYSASMLNISAMSFGSLSHRAILALNMGAKAGNFAHNTGEGGLSPYHREGGGDVIWQIGTGYFGCRDQDGNFDAEMFKESATLPQVKMIEIKLSQGAKPGHGGILPAAKLTQEIADIRKVPMGHDVVSPRAHSAFSTPRGLLKFISKLRELSGGKPVGFKLCVGRPSEFFAICKAIVETKTAPDFIVVDGGEGGSGAAPVEFSNQIGTPLVEGLIFVHNSLVGFGIRDQIRIISSGRVTTGFGVVKRMALGADACYSARGMMMALGCIQALQCNSNNCPVGVATQKKRLTAGLVPSRKSLRVKNFHLETMHSVREIVGAMGLGSPAELRPWHVLRRTSRTVIEDYSMVYDFVEEGAFLRNDVPERFRRAFAVASSDSFGRGTDR